MLDHGLLEVSVQYCTGSCYSQCDALCSVNSWGLYTGCSTWLGVAEVGPAQARERSVVLVCVLCLCVCVFYCQSPYRSVSFWWHKNWWLLDAATTKSTSLTNTPHTSISCPTGGHIHWTRYDLLFLSFHSWIRNSSKCSYHYFVGNNGYFTLRPYWAGEQVSWLCGPQEHVGSNTLVYW